MAWDEDSDEENAPSTPQITMTVDDTTAMRSEAEPCVTPQSHAPPQDLLKPEGRRSHDEKSVADSDASYDLVSGATSCTPGSPKEKVFKGRAEESDDEEDWE